MNEHASRLRAPVGLRAVARLAGRRQRPDLAFRAVVLRRDLGADEPLPALEARVPKHVLEPLHVRVPRRAHDDRVQFPRRRAGDDGVRVAAPVHHARHLRAHGRFVFDARFAYAPLASAANELS